VNGWIEVSEERLAGNYRAIAAAAGAETDVMAVVKANAYGHGADVCAVALARAGAKWFGVASVTEGVRVRVALECAGYSPEKTGQLLNILVFCGFLESEVPLVEKHSLAVVLWNSAQVKLLHDVFPMSVHVEVDTGMGRQGVRPGEALDALLDEMKESGLHLEGLMTHFSSAEVANSDLTQTQERRFTEAVIQVRQRNLMPLTIHAGSSSTVDNPAQDRPWLVKLAGMVGARAMVRCGIALYGYCLPIEGSVEPRIRGKLRPAMTWKTRVMDVRDVAAGETGGYNATFTAQGPMRLALLGVGYSDGLRRPLSSTNEKAGGWVMIDGRRAAIVGRVSMNLTMVDVTGIEGVRVGDEVVLLGDGVTADDHARLAGTISYEILCGVRVG
jgi:alanine racemase